MTAPPLREGLIPSYSLQLTGMVECDTTLSGWPTKTCLAAGSKNHRTLPVAQLAEHGLAAPRIYSLSSVNRLGLPVVVQNVRS